MSKKSLFQADFEESLHLEDDAFLQYQLKDQNKKLARLPKKGLASFKITLLNLVLTLLFPVGLNFIVLAISIAIQESNPKDLALPISNQNFLTAPVYLIGLLIWLLLVFVGKVFKQTYLHPYRNHFHVVTFLVWFIIEFNLAAVGLALPFLSVWGLFTTTSFILLLAVWLFRIEIRNLKERMYGQMNGSNLQDKIASKISAYGMGILGIGVLMNFVLRMFSIKTSSSLTVFGLFLAWVVLNIGVLAMLIFMEIPYFLQAYYKWKYPEEYREWEGKTAEEWYGKKYLKKHKELWKDES